MAVRLGIPLSVLEREMDYSEFVEMCCFIDWEMKQNSKQDYYLAQIAAMLSGKKKAKIKDYLIQFGDKKKKALKISGSDQVNLFKKLFGIKNGQ